MDEKKRQNERASYFRQARKKRFSELAEDYTELIADLKLDKGCVRICDLSREMGISHVSVIKTIKRLTRDGYLVEGSSPFISLSKQGEELACFSKKKHLVLSDFLRRIGVSEGTVATDVEGIEHYISLETLQAIESHMKKMSC